MTVGDDMYDYFLVCVCSKLQFQEKSVLLEANPFWSLDAMIHDADVVRDGAGCFGATATPVA